MGTPSHQSPKELTFCVFERPIHPELFEIHASRRFFQGDYEAMIWVTGSSHVISVFMDGACITELLCPVDQPLPQHGQLECLAMHSRKTHQFSLPGRLGYMMNCQVERMSANLFRQMHRDLKTMGKKRGLLVTHPPIGPGQTAPLSYIDYEARVEELHVHTFHTLPEEHTFIKSQSLFKLKPAAAHERARIRSRKAQA